MRIPIFDELKIKNFRLENLIDRLKRSKVGESPFYINADGLDTPVKEIINNLDSALKSLNVHPNYPYPLFVITKETVDYHGPIQIVANTSLLPEYFSVLKPRRLKGKEVGLLNKVYALSQKIINLNIYETLGNFQENIRIQREVSNRVKLISKMDKVIGHLKKEDSDYE